REQLVAGAHDHELRREELPGRMRGADVLAAPALRARERVDYLLPRQVRRGRDPEAELIVRNVEAQRLEPARRARAGEPDIRRGRCDVQVFRARDVPKEGEDEGEVGP